MNKFNTRVERRAQCADIEAALAAARDMCQGILAPVIRIDPSDMPPIFSGRLADLGFDVEVSGLLRDSEATR